MDNDIFISEIKKIYVSEKGLKEKLNLSENLTDYNAFARIEYALEPEYRSWGCKGIYCDIKKLGITIEWETENNRGTLDVDGMSSEYERTVDAKLHEDGQFSIDDCDIDLEKKLITLY